DFKTVTVRSASRPPLSHLCAASIPKIHYLERSPVWTLQPGPDMLTRWIGRSPLGPVPARVFVFASLVKEAVIIMIRLPNSVQSCGWAGHEGPLRATAVQGLNRSSHWREPMRGDDTHHDNG